MNRHSLKIGTTFGLASGIITTLGLMVGLHSGTHSKAAVLGGIATIAVADAFSDALGIHMSEESEEVHTPKEIWQSTFFTFLAKFVFAGIFVIPVLLIDDLGMSIIVSVAIGLSILIYASYRIAKAQNENPLSVIAEHFIIACVVIAATHYLGDLVSALTG